jgi:hypothetical protein
MTVALIRYGNEAWQVHPGDVLTFGRGPGCDIRLADDQHLSRRAGALLGQDGYLVIRNDSTSKPIVLRPPIGEDRVIEPAAATTSLPLRCFDLILYGAGAVPVVLTVDAGPPPTAPDWQPGGTASTVTAPITLSPTQRRVLLALCEPMLTLRGPAARPATYAEIGQRLDLKPGYVRNVVKTLRESLTGHGLAGLSEDAQDAAVDDFRRALAQWAVRSSWVSPDQLSELEGRVRDREP